MTTTNNKDPIGLKRQGDILFVPTKEIPETHHLENSRHGIIAEGEISGHLHKFEGAGQLLMHPEQKGQTIGYLKVQDGKVTHNEHREISLEAGNYEIKRQREFRPKEVVRNVQD